jgi:hypothetical protein
MHHRFSKFSALAAIALAAACSGDVVAPRMAPSDGASRTIGSLPVINVSTIDSLYAVVNNPANAGRDVRLEPGAPYMLDPSRPFGGRLQLQQDMTLRGKAGYAATVIIDASALGATQLTDGILTGAIRVGRGTNTIESLTIRNASAGAAGIETDLVGTGPTVVNIAHVIATGNTRGIDVRNIGAAMAGRALVLTLSDNELFDNIAVQGQGLRIVNAAGATGASINASIDNNKIHGNIAGILVANLNVSGGKIILDSHADRFENNGNGSVFLAGTGNASHDTISVRAQSSRWVNNGVGGAPLAAVDIGAILASGGTTAAGDVSSNSLVVDLWGILFSGNVNPDIAAFGAQLIGTATGTGDNVTIGLHGMSKSAIVNPEFGSVVGTNTVTVIRY